MGCERGESGSVSRCVVLLVEFPLLSHFDGSIDNSRDGHEMRAPKCIVAVLLFVMIMFV